MNIDAHKCGSGSGQGRDGTGVPSVILLYFSGAQINPGHTAPTSWEWIQTYTLFLALKVL